MNKAELNSLIRTLMQTLDRTSPRFEEQQELVAQLHDAALGLIDQVEQERALRFAAV